ncbi:Uncharacterized conserved protein YndB, AHSA1/START domain [Jatrophihabitans endophyticus]|uniref:Uncharacterized conserved protein YndB, AHSA1/START domain n=1 Tax=Jatrophihabitans endophyticus TaxID=1206085 RepID=A0A1M5E688_9ACTN|nr:SRPBCC domain-containing protein [Jatrophihabitans endophyticus]SHF74695.1 Uncharacterized conserved protein YndB, AHSA1/START domain [Jatrophihabitans endophyticus]
MTTDETTTTDDLTRIEVDQYFPHPPAKVWRALTTPDLMAEWLMPNDFRPVVGTRFVLRARPVAQTGFSGLIACEVLDLVPQQRLRISWRDADPSHAMDTTVTWTLHAEGDGTRLVLEHAGFDADDPTQQLARSFMGGGWRGPVLGRLLDLLRQPA